MEQYEPSQNHPSARLSRRDMLRASAMVSLAGFLGGCASARPRTTRLPDPVWPAREPIAPRPHTPVIEPIDPTPIESFAVVPRAGWTRAGIARPHEAFPMNGVRRITVHHDAMVSSDLRSTADVAARIERHRRFHVENRGWADIGYHYVVDPQGTVWEARPLDRQGAHVRNHNEHNIGVMMLGNFEHQTPSLPALHSLDRFIPHLMRRHNVGASSVYTHQEFAPTLCPGRNLQRHMAQARAAGGAISVA